MELAPNTPASKTSLLKRAMEKQAASTNAPVVGLQGSQMLYNTYRPTTLDQMVGQTAIRADVAEWFSTGNVPRFTIFYSDGVPGVGKDVLADIIARYILEIPSTTDPRKDVAKRYLVLNCKADGGIDAVRKALDIVNTPPLEMPGYVPRYVLNLTELQGLSEAALEAILLATENPPPWVWFVATTTNLDKVRKSSTSKNSKGGSSPLVSRAVVKRLLPISADDIMQRLLLVAQKEGVYSSVIDEDVLSSAALQAGGSMRTALSLLESIRYGTNKETLLGQLDAFVNEDNLSLKQIATALVYDFYSTVDGDKISCSTYMQKYALILYYCNSVESGEAGRANLISAIGKWLGLSEEGAPSPGICTALGTTPAKWPKGDRPLVTTAVKAGPNFIRAITVLECLLSEGILGGALHESRAQLLVALSNVVRKTSTV